jgi:hypothetical protein
LAAGRAQVELYVRWTQEVRRFKPSTVSRQMTVVVDFYRTCVIDAVLARSPAEHVRRPAVPHADRHRRAGRPAGGRLPARWQYYEFRGQPVRRLSRRGRVSPLVRPGVAGGPLLADMQVIVDHHIMPPTRGLAVVGEQVGEL